MIRQLTLRLDVANYSILRSSDAFFRSPKAAAVLGERLEEQFQGTEVRAVAAVGLLGQ